MMKVSEFKRGVMSIEEAKDAELTPLVIPEGSNSWIVAAVNESRRRHGSWYWTRVTNASPQELEQFADIFLDLLYHKFGRP